MASSRKEIRIKTLARRGGGWVEGVFAASLIGGWKRSCSSTLKGRERGGKEILYVARRKRGPRNWKVSIDPKKRGKVYTLFLEWKRGITVDTGDWKTYDHLNLTACVGREGEKGKGKGTYKYQPIQRKGAPLKSKKRTEG